MDKNIPQGDQELGQEIDQEMKSQELSSELLGLADLVRRYSGCGGNRNQMFSNHKTPEPGAILSEILAKTKSSPAPLIGYIASVKNEQDGTVRWMTIANAETDQVLWMDDSEDASVAQDPKTLVDLFNRLCKLPARPMMGKFFPPLPLVCALGLNSSELATHSGEFQVHPVAVFPAVMTYRFSVATVSQDEVKEDARPCSSE
jgi:hypothetical protein